MHIDEVWIHQYGAFRHSDFIAEFTVNAQQCQVLSLWHRSAMKGVIERCRKTSADVQRWKYERTISRHLYWNDVTLMVHSDFIAAHRSTNICVRNAGGHVQNAVLANVGWCKAIEVWMHSTTIFRFQAPPFLTWKFSRFAFGAPPASRYQRPARERHKIRIASREIVDTQAPCNTNFTHEHVSVYF